ncbi:MAG: nucleotidyltransferase [Tissierellia bacterium]|nr:nucleotidyltransferase [Tissierellia bacterium]
MKITGVVAEYNPFHAGHEYQLKKARELSGCDGIAVVMSGNYVQRGEPAIIDKFKRAEAAIYGGADIVIELPMPFSCQNAEIFSFAAIRELSKLRINSISFGCENDRLELLKKIANAQLLPEFNARVRKEMKKGISYGNAMTNSLKSILGDAEAVYMPNNVLAVEYIKSAIKLNLNIDFYPVKRLGMNYNDTVISESFHSATAIRKGILEGNYSNLKLTEKSFQSIEDFYSQHKKFNTLDNYIDYLYYKIIDLGSSLDEIYEVKEGLDNKILANVFKYNNVDEFIMSLKSKRYTYSKVRRCLLNILLSISKSDINTFLSHSTDYVKVLAFNDRGRDIIKYAKNKETKVVNRYSDYKKYNLNPEELPVFNLTKKASDIYYLPLENRKINSEYRENAVYIS